MICLYCNEDFSKSNQNKPLYVCRKCNVAYTILNDEIIKITIKNDSCPGYSIELDANEQTTSLYSNNGYYDIVVLNYIIDITSEHSEYWFKKLLGLKVFI